MNSREAMVEGIQRVLHSELARPGIRPRLISGVRVQCDDSGVTLHHPLPGSSISLSGEIYAQIVEGSLDKVPAQAWPLPLFALWNAGFILLVDDESSFGSTVDFSGACQVLLRRSQVGDFTIFGSGPVVMLDSSAGSHCALMGALVLQKTEIGRFNCIGRGTMIENSVLGSHVQAQIFVDVKDSIVEGYVGLDGGVHPEQYPMVTMGEVPRGVSVGPNAHVEAQAVLCAGARVGRGERIAAQSIVGARRYDLPRQVVESPNHSVQPTAEALERLLGTVIPLPQQVDRAAPLARFGLDSMGYLTFAQLVQERFGVAHIDPFEDDTLEKVLARLSAPESL